MCPDSEIRLNLSVFYFLTPEGFVRFPVTPPQNQRRVPAWSKGLYTRKNIPYIQCRAERCSAGHQIINEVKKDMASTIRNKKTASTKNTTKNTNLPPVDVSVTPQYGAIISLPVLDGDGNQKKNFRGEAVVLRLGIDKASSVLTYADDIKAFYTNHLNDRPEKKVNTATMRKADVVAAYQEERESRIELMKRLEALEASMKKK